MKKLLLILSITLISNISFAAFPIIEKSQNESAQVSNFGENDNRNILLLALATLPLGAITVGVAAISTGFLKYILFGLLVLLTLFAPVYSTYLNINAYNRDWRNYLAFFFSAIFGLAAFLLAVLAIGIGLG